MSDNFIPLNQSTPVQERWSRNQHQGGSGGYKNGWQHNNNRNRNHHKWGNNSRRSSSFGSESNSSYGRDNRSNIDAYLHPSMLQDPWAHLRKKDLQTSSQI